MRVYPQANDGDVFHYRDKSELEVDLIVRLRDGRWGAISQKKLVVSCKLWRWKIVRGSCSSQGIYLKTSQIVVITGVRRCGKSSLMFLIKKSLGLKESEFCYCNFDDERIATYPTLLNDIYVLHLEMYRTEPVFFFDEIQEVPGWVFGSQATEAGFWRMRYSWS
jgi:hypothetical protein